MTRTPGAPRGRSAEAKKRRAPKRNAVLRASGSRVACDVCRLLHKPPVCPPDAEPVQFCVVLPPHVARELNERVLWGDRSTYVVGLLRKALDV